MHTDPVRNFDDEYSIVVTAQRDYVADRITMPA